MRLQLVEFDRLTPENLGFSATIACVRQAAKSFAGLSLLIVLILVILSFYELENAVYLSMTVILGLLHCTKCVYAEMNSTLVTC